MSADKDGVELLPCPFCGGEASDAGHIAYNRALDDTTWADGSPVTEAFYVNCIACGAVARSGFVGGFQTKVEAIERWNHRARPTPAHEQGWRTDDCRARGDWSEDAVEQLAHELSWELEEASLSANDYVTVNREKLRTIAKRVLARLPPPLTKGGEDA